MKKPHYILLIEDNEFINIFNRRIIEQAGISHRIEICGNGQEGLEYLERQATQGITDDIPDLILLDLNMPRVNGWEFMEEFALLKNRLGKKVVIFILSTSPNPDDTRRAEQMPDIAAFIAKPLTKEVLVRLVEKHFSEEEKIL